MIKLTQITGGCLKCRYLRIKNNLFESDVYCKKGYEYPHIADRSKWVGHCDHLDYDDDSCAKWGDNLALCRKIAPERLSKL